MITCVWPGGEYTPVQTPRPPSQLDNCGTDGDSVLYQVDQPGSEGYNLLFGNCPEHDECQGFFYGPAFALD
ncbi:hypothetical protein BK671_09470 [Pseudomonas fluorescens]|uniref:Uncharacterized protein n=1 Tax=Pseudomonas fluorescens TaxID=294 RepID=A0A423LMX3_PSEFL|nr:hypothetical protein BK671_09470 [Pseudomonas fluorescens]